MLQKLILCAVAALTLVTADAQQLRTPAASPTQTIKQDFGISSVELTYSRPAMKGRKVFGDLVPYGKLWRTGANAASKIKFADDVKIGGTTLKAGEYVVYTIPNQNEWEVIFNKGLTNWGVDGYKESDDVARIKVKPIKLDEPIESFTMQFMDIKSNSTNLYIAWDKTAVAVPITTDVDSKVMAQINNTILKDSRPYAAAASYYLETGRDINQALTWYDKAIEQNPKAFWLYHQKANALVKAGKKEEARKTAQRSMELAKEANNNDYVRLNEKLIADLK